MLFDQLPTSTARVLRTLLVASLVIVAGISLSLTFFATATWDDFCRGAWSKDAGAFLSVVKDNYLHWSGRWAVHSIYALTFPHLGITSINYNLLLALSAVIWFTVFYIFLHILLRKSAPVKQKAFIAALLTAIYWVGMPDPGDTWYWLTGSTEYQLPFLLMSLSLLVLTSSWITGGKLAPRVGATVLGGVLAVLVTGLQEFAGLLLLGAMGVAFLLALARKRGDVAAIYSVILVIVAAGLAFNLAAPGTEARIAEDFAQPSNIGFGIKALISPRTSPVSWLGDARLWCLGALLATSPAFLKLRPEWASWKLPLPGRFSSMVVMAPLIGFVAVLAGAFVVNYAQGADAPPRVLNLLYAVLIVGWVAALVPLGRLIGEDAERQGPILRGVKLGAAVLLPVTLLIAPNTLKAVNDLPVIVNTWRPALNARITEIDRRVAAGDTSLVLKPIGSDPKSYRWDDIGANDADWKNECMARFYGALDMRTDATATSAN